MNEAKYDMKNYGDRGGCYWPRRITTSDISIILHMIRKLNLIIVLLFIQNNSFDVKVIFDSLRLGLS